MVESATVKVNDHHLQFEQREHYVYFRLDGESSDYLALRRSLQEIAEKSSRCNCQRIMVENNILNEVELGDVFRLTNDLPVIGFARFRLAVVNEKFRSQETNEFANNVAKNRTIQMRAFSSVPAAETWLLS